MSPQLFKSKIKRYKRLVTFLFSILVFFSIFYASYSRVFDTYEFVLLDLRFKARPQQDFLDDIVIIEIADDALGNLGQWPLPRDFHASLIDVLSEFKVKQVFFDILFSEKTKWDTALINAMKKANNVYLAFAFRLDEDIYVPGMSSSETLIAPLLEDFKNASLASGHINIATDTDGKSRRAPLFIQYKGARYPHAALKAACDYIGLPLKKTVFKGNSVVIDQQLEIPISKKGSMLINYVGPWTESFQHYSYYDILAAYQERRLGKAPRIDLELLKDKVCFVGLTATGTLDLHAVPVEPIYPMVGLHANIFNSIIQQKFLRRVGELINVFVLAALIAVALLITLRLKPLKSFLAILVLGSGFTAACFSLFIFLGLWLDLFYPLVVVSVLYLAVTLFRFLKEERKNELLEKELSIAKKIQESFLPDPIGTFADLEIATDMITAKHVGGDLFDIRVLSDKKIGVFIGDVAGKGVSAALVMAKAISLFRLFATEDASASSVLYRLNDELAKDIKTGLFVTATYIIYTSGDNKATIASAGHLPTILFRSANEQIEKIDVKEGMPLGIMQGVEFSEEVIQLHASDRLFLYTDGVVEAKNIKRTDFEEERFIDCIVKTKQNSAAEAIDSIEYQIKKFVGKAPQHDDVTIVVLKKIQK
ncbi:CHASE2 domain-containing protein [Candidatus Omnitrophota bacterium]